MEWVGVLSAAASAPTVGTGSDDRPGPPAPTAAALERSSSTHLMEAQTSTWCKRTKVSEEILPSRPVRVTADNPLLGILVSR